MKNLPALLVVLGALFGGVLMDNAFAAPPATTPCTTKKPLLVVLVYDEACKTTCSVVRPVVRDLAGEQCQRIEYVELNTSAGSLPASLEKASQLNIKRFVEDRTDQVPLVGLFACQSDKAKLVKELVGFKNKDVYKQAIEKAMEKAVR